MLADVSILTFMGLFWNWNKQKDVPAPSASPQQEPQKKLEKERLTQPVVLPGEPKPQPQPEQHPYPVQPKAVPVHDAKPHVEIEMRKLVFRLSSHDPEKCGLFIKELIRKINRHDWHDLTGRIGKHSDGIKMRIDIKGKHDDIQSCIKWFKMDHLGVHAYEVMESKVHSMPYSGFPGFQELKSSWPTH